LILLDTNVLSAVMRRDPPEVVVAWLDRQPARSIWTTAVTVFEIEYGLQRLPDGKRRRDLEKAFRAVIAEDLEGRVLPFDSQAAFTAGALAAEREAAGERPEVRDLQIAAIARARNATIATRNVKHFAGVCPVINPWG